MDEEAYREEARIKLSSIQPTFWLYLPISRLHDRFTPSDLGEAGYESDNHADAERDVGKPAAPSLHPRFCWNVNGITDKRKATNQMNSIQSPNAKTMDSVISIWAALIEECWSNSLMFLASRSISALLSLVSRGNSQSFPALVERHSPLVSRRKTTMTMKRYTFASS
jgi:hypothetical protein